MSDRPFGDRIQVAGVTYYFPAIMLGPFSFTQDARESGLIIVVGPQEGLVAVGSGDPVLVEFPELVSVAVEAGHTLRYGLRDDVFTEGETLVHWTPTCPASYSVWAIWLRQEDPIPEPGTSWRDRAPML